VQARGRLDRALTEYDNLLEEIEAQADLLRAQYALDAEEISILRSGAAEAMSLARRITSSRAIQMDFRKVARISVLTSDAMAEFLPTAVGLATDATSTLRGALRLFGAVQSELFSQEADRESMAELDLQNAKEGAQLQQEITLATLRQELPLRQQVAQLQQLVRQETALRYELYNQLEALQQFAAVYRSVLARGNRLLEERLRFRQQTASQIQAYRYKDFAFRIFRNDALQKYRAQFDLASMYVYLAATAYDYETCLLRSDRKSGAGYLTEIVRKRALGKIGAGGLPLPPGLGDPGLAGVMYDLKTDFETYRFNYRVDNQVTLERLFSLRAGWFRFAEGTAGSAKWREALRQRYVANLWEIPEFRRYCEPPRPEPAGGEPAIVIEFPSVITADQNFFGWPAGGGDSSYPPTYIANKIKAAGVWFSNYDSSSLGLQQNPYVWLVPVGADVLRAPPIESFQTREWMVVDQKIPGGRAIDPASAFIPIFDALDDRLAELRKFRTLEASYILQTGILDTSRMRTDSSLVGRSVWNQRWMLIIPGVGLLGGDPTEGLQRFVLGARLPGGQYSGSGVTDIKIFFQTYHY
jgi:hypothetical protein